MTLKSSAPPSEETTEFTVQPLPCPVHQQECKCPLLYGLVGTIPIICGDGGSVTVDMPVYFTRAFVEPAPRVGKQETPPIAASGLHVLRPAEFVQGLDKKCLIDTPPWLSTAPNHAGVLVPREVDPEGEPAWAVLGRIITVPDDSRPDVLILWSAFVRVDDWNTRVRPPITDWPPYDGDTILEAFHRCVLAEVVGGVMASVSDTVLDTALDTP